MEDDEHSTYYLNLDACQNEKGFFSPFFLDLLRQSLPGLCQT